MGREARVPKRPRDLYYVVLAMSGEDVEQAAQIFGVPKTTSMIAQARGCSYRLYIVHEPVPEQTFKDGHGDLILRVRCFTTEEFAKAWCESDARLPRRVS